VRERERERKRGSNKGEYNNKQKSTLRSTAHILLLLLLLVFLHEAPRAFVSMTRFEKSWSRVDGAHILLSLGAAH
jgi:hypothetical protein